MLEMVPSYLRRTGMPTRFKVAYVMRGGEVMIAGIKREKPFFIDKFKYDAVQPQPERVPKK